MKSIALFFVLITGFLASAAQADGDVVVLEVKGGIGVATGAVPAGAWALGLGLAAWLAMAVAAGPATRAFGLGWAWRLALPVAGLLYGAMTVDSALRGPRGGGWR